MYSKEKDIRDTKRTVGWVYPQLKWLTEDEAKRANDERDKILNSLPGERIHYGSRRNKIYSGDLSPGCHICGQGTWSCLFITRMCTANCFFCPRNRKVKEEKKPETEGIKIDVPNDYVEYLEKFGFKGVGFSGGEPMLVFEKLLLFIEKIRQRFGKEIYIWVYTNGDLVDADKLKILRNVGLDEIRFNICARMYDLKPVELARNFINTVTVEIPAIPGDYDELKRHILKMQEIGVDYLNLHQLFATENNYREFTNRGYTFLHSPTVFPPVLESEITALKLLRHALEHDIRLPINYCSHIYKKRFQCSANRKRASTLTREEFEHLTEAGYIRRLAVKDSPINVKTIVNILRKNKARENMWSLDKTEAELLLHHSLLKYVDFKKYSLTVTYFEPLIILKSNGIGEEQNCNMEFSVKRKIVDQNKLSSTGIESFKRLYIENIDIKDVFSFYLDNRLKSKEDIYNMQKETQILMAFREWEHLGEGFPEIY